MVVAGLFVTTTALADDNRWDGLKIGVGVGGSYSSAKSKLNAAHDTSYDFTNESDEGSEWFNGDANGNSNLGKGLGFGTLDATYDWQVSDNVVFGVIGNYDVSARSKVKGNASGGANAGWDYTDYNDYSGSEGSPGTDCSESGCYSTSNANSRTGATSSFETGNSGALGLRLGFLANKDTLIYATGGWTTIKVKQNASYRSNVGLDNDEGYANEYSYSSNASKSSNESGYFVGAGIQTKFSDHISAKLEYRYSDYGSIKNRNNASGDLVSGPDLEYSTDLSGTSSINQKTDLTLHTIRAVVSYDF